MVEQPGVIRVLVNGKLRAKPFLDIRSLVRSRRRAGPALGRVPSALRDATTASSSTTPTATATRAWSSTARTARAALPKTARRLLFVEAAVSPTTTAASSQFGPDGRLYVGMGDGGSGGDPRQPRAEPDVTPRQAAAPERRQARRAAGRSPATGCATRGASRSTGSTGDLYIGDVGQDAWEEVDVRTPRQRRGAEQLRLARLGGPLALHAGQQVNPRGTLVFPIVVYSHSQGCSITGGYVYRGQADHLGATAATSTATTAAARSGACAPRAASSLGAAARAVQGPEPLLVRRGRGRRALRDLARRHGLQARG